MRQIKFRALIEGKWVYYDFLLTADVERFADDKWTIDKLSQFTGLLDKNGKEIWEGDVVRTIDMQRPVVGEVVFAISVPEKMTSGDNMLAEYCIKEQFLDRRGQKKWQFVIFAHPIEVIGNVWENPELLK